MYYPKLKTTISTLLFALSLLLVVFMIPGSAYALGEDETAPQLKSVRVLASEVQKPGVMRVSLDLVEEQTGIAAVDIELSLLDENGDIAGGNTVQTTASGGLSDVSLYSGQHTFDIPIPETVKNGKWVFKGVSIRDNAGNDTNYYYNHPHIFTPNGDYYEDPYIACGIDESVKLPIENCYFTVTSEFDIAFQYGADNPNLANALTNMKDGESGVVLVNSNNGYTIPAAAFSAIKAQNKYLIVYDGGVQWVFYGKDILDEDKSIDVRTSISTVSGSEYGVKDDVVQVTFADNGKLPGKAQIRLKSDYLYNKAGIKGAIFVYYKNKDSITLESSSEELVMDGTDKWCYFNIDHNSTFILSANKLKSNSSGSTNSNNDGSSTSSANSGNGIWMHNSKGWWYQYSDKSYAKGLKKIGSATYYFDSKGWMKTGWQKVSGTWYYFKSSGAMATGWQKVSGKWYYLGSDGKMTTGKQTISGKTYFLNSSGAMRTGWIQSGSKWYYCKSSGEATKGWTKVKNTWYFMGSDCVMKTGWMQDNGKTYYLKSSGAMAKGWQKISGTWYYFNGGGDMAKGWKKLSGKWYYLATDGKMATSKQTIAGKPYFFNGSGALKTGWVKDSNGDYYYYTSGGTLKTNAWISGKYWVDSKGVMATNAWVDGGKYYVDGAGKWVKGKTR